MKSDRKPMGVALFIYHVFLEPNSSAQLEEGAHRITGSSFCGRRSFWTTLPKGKDVSFLILHTVRPGESVYTIARRYGADPQTIISDNGLDEADQLVIGQSLVIQVEDIPHTVTRGQSLYSIAKGYGVSLDALLAANPQIEDPSRIAVGQIILVPMKSPKLGTIEVNGYAFPNINMDTLNKTLPYLTYLSIFSYQVREDGSLSAINDTPLIQAARAQNVAPVMVITNIEEGASFSSELANAILSDEAVQDTLLNNIVSILESKDYAGLGIDFEYVYREDRENYNNFLRKATERLRPLGYIVTTALAPKTSADQPGLLYGAHDYPVHGELVDHVILMTYEWGYTYGPPMAVAPVNQVRRVLDYAVGVIPGRKILMGMPNYGYDWTLPFVQGSAARSLSNTQAVDLARRVGATIQYDTTSQAPFFNYYDPETRSRHEVWFDDARSIQARLRLVEQYHLGGVSYWTINRFFPQNWLVLSSMYDVKKVL
jgi:spore germination protein